MQGGEFQAAPPVNNLLQPDVFNRLDAQVRERTRVVNSQLDQRLLAQQNILTKYRTASERLHRRERHLVVQELSRISNRLPAVSRIRDFRNKFLYGEGIHDDHHHHHGGSLREGSQGGSLREGIPGGSLSHAFSLPDVRGAVPATTKKKKKIRGVPEERPEMPFCQRFFLHHLPTKNRYYRTRATPSPPLPPAPDDVTTPAALPPLPGTASELSHAATKQEWSDTRMAPIEDKAPGDGSRAVEDSACLAGSNRPLSSSSPLWDQGLGEERVKDDNRGARFSDEEGPPGGLRTRGVLPPLARQNVRLAHSSPQLFHG